jgi:hypothetical protein
MRSDSTCSGYHYPDRNQWGVHNRFGAITHEINSEHEAFEILTFQGVKYSAFLKEDEERESKWNVSNYQAVQQLIRLVCESSLYRHNLETANGLLWSYWGGATLRRLACEGRSTRRG